MVEGKSARRQLSGLEAWFRDGQEPIPPRWKMALLTWPAVWLVSMLVRAILAPALGPNIPQVIESGLITAGVVATLTWVAMPYVVKIARPWLRPEKTATIIDHDPVGSEPEPVAKKEKLGSLQIRAKPLGQADPVRARAAGSSGRVNHPLSSRLSHSRSRRGRGSDWPLRAISRVPTPPHWFGPYAAFRRHRFWLSHAIRYFAILHCADQNS